MIDKENEKTLGKKTHEGKILIYCGGNILLLQRWCQASCVATYSSYSGVFCCDILLLLRRWCCVVTYSSSSGVFCCDVLLLLRRWCTRLVLRRTPPPPALVSHDLCCNVLLLLRRWCYATGVATYSFSHVKSKRLLPLVGNPRHETQPIIVVQHDVCSPLDMGRTTTAVVLYHQHESLPERAQLVEFTRQQRSGAERCNRSAPKRKAEYEF